MHLGSTLILLGYPERYSELFGSVIGILMSLSRLKKRFIGMNYLRIGYFLFVACSLALLLAGLLALISGQPYGIWYGVGIPRLIGLILSGSMYPLMFRLPKQLEAEWKTQNG